MIKWIGTLAVGIALGAAGVLLAQRALDGGLAGVLQPNGTPAPTPQPFEPPAPLHEPSPSPGTAVVSLAQIQDVSYGFERTAALFDLLRSADIRRIEALLEEADAADLGWMVWPIYSRYVDLAPQAALNHLVSREPIQTSQVYSALFAWALEDLDAALTFAETLDQPLRTQAGRNLLYTLVNLSDDRREEIAKRLSVETELTRMRAAAEAASNPANAWQNALAMEAGESRTQTLWAVAWRWFDQSPSAALSALNSVVDTDQRDSWQVRLWERWIETDREAALQWAVSQPPSEKRTSRIAEVAAAVAEDSPAEMLALADRLDTAARREVAQRVLAVWAKSDPRAALAALDELAGTLDTRARREVARGVLGVWAKSDPRAALAALDEMDDRRLKQTTEQSLVFTWTQSDPMAAFEWARTRPASDNRTGALSSALRQVAQSDPGQALALAEDLDGNARTWVIDSVLQQWGRDDPRAAAAWLDSSSHESRVAASNIIDAYARLDAEEAVDWLLTQPADAQQHAVSMIMGPLAEESPEVALDLVDRLEDPTTTAIAGSQLMSRWAADDPRAAVRAIARLDGDARPALYTSAFSTWSRHDPQGADAFVGQIPASGRDAAILGMMQQALSSENVESAERLFERIDSTESRQAAATSMYFQLNRTDPERAERYREMSGITVDEDGSVILRLPAQGF